MAFPVECSCGKRFEAKSSLIGKTLSCPACSSSLSIKRPVGGDKIPVKCGCGGAFAAPDYLAKESVPCPNCGVAISIPAASAAGKTVPPKSSSAAASKPKQQPKVKPVDNEPQFGVDDLLGDPGDLFADADDSLDGFDTLEDVPLAASSSGSRPRKRSSAGINMPLVIGGIVGCGAFVLVCLVISHLVSSMGGSDTPETPAKVAVVTQPRSNQPARESNEEATRDTKAPKSNGSDSSVKVEDSNETEESKEQESGYNPDLGNQLASTFQTWESRPGSKLVGVNLPKDQDSVLGGFSWMTKLLPHMGYQEIYDEIEFDESWMTSSNMVQAAQIIPEFQNPLDDRERWEGYPFRGIALSHFVGISGVEKRRTEVAAKFSRKHPQAGVFGYHDVMRSEDITDGTSNTVMVVGAGELAGPWASGGGATIRGARKPHFGGISGFGTKGAEKEGTVVLRADGSSKFISGDIDPKIFEAMCTAHGQEKVDYDSNWGEAIEIPESKVKKFRKTKIRDSEESEDDDHRENHNSRRKRER